jgi:hypothetical protein
MLSCPREAHNLGNQRVVLAVRSPVRPSKQLVETMRWTFSPAIGYIESQGTKTWRGHRDQQPRLGLTTLS